MISDEAINKARLDLFRSAAASLIEGSRDVGLTADQYDEIEAWLPAMIELFRKHRKEYGDQEK